MKKLISPAILISICLLFTGCTNSFNLSQKMDQFKEAKDTIANIEVELSSTQAQHVVIVPGYGAPVVGNSGYESYIQEVADFVTDETNDVNAVIFTGSYSSLKNTSEAQSMASYYKSISSSNVTVYEEECAIVSWQNISNSKELLDSKGIVPNKITVFGDKAREDKLVAFATYKFNEDQSISKESISLAFADIDFHGYDFGTDESDQEAKFAAEMAGANDAEVGNEILKLRISEWTNTFGYDVAKNLVSKGCSEFKGFQ